MKNKMKRQLSGLLIIFIGILLGIVTGLLLYFILLKNKTIYDNDILTFIIGLAIFGLVFFILMIF